MRIRVYDKHLGSYFQSEVYAIINTGYYEKYLVSVPSESGGYMKLYDYLDKSDKKASGPCEHGYSPRAGRMDL